MTELALGASIRLRHERFPLSGAFRISRGAKTHADVLVAEITEGAHTGRGEAVPYARYGESFESIFELARARVGDEDAIDALPPGALRNALDLARWDLRAQLHDRSVAELTSLEDTPSVQTALTISIDTPDAMAAAAATTEGTLLKLKLQGDALDAARLEAVHAARPDARLWLDANEGLDRERYLALVPAFEALPIVLLEQPFPVGEDALLSSLPRPMPICADESAHDASSLASLADRYDAVNVKLDKTGGLTEAIATMARARALDLEVAIGCMVSTSLALAPAFLLVSEADYVDLDGALFLSSDRPGGTKLTNGVLRAPSPALWGWPRETNRS